MFERMAACECNESIRAVQKQPVAENVRRVGHKHHVSMFGYDVRRHHFYFRPGLVVFLILFSDRDRFYVAFTLPRFLDPRQVFNPFLPTTFLQSLRRTIYGPETTEITCVICFCSFYV